MFRIAGGAPMYVHDLSALPAPASYLQVPPQQFAALPRVPLDGTFVGTPDGVLYRVAGGAPFVVTQSSLFVSLHPVEIDSWDLDHLSDPRAHLNAAPADGTVLQGLPSRGYWIFTGAKRRRTTSAPAIQVDDAGLAAYPMKGCLVPRLLGLTLGGVRGVLRQTDCRLGQVGRHGGPAAGHPLRVIGQFPAAGSRRPPLTAVQVTIG